VFSPWFYVLQKKLHRVAQSRHREALRKNSVFLCVFSVVLCVTKKIN
jgi:hypothetical protein